MTKTFVAAVVCVLGACGGSKDTPLAPEATDAVLAQLNKAGGACGPNIGSDPRNADEMVMCKQDGAAVEYTFNRKSRRFESLQAQFDAKDAKDASVKFEAALSSVATPALLEKMRAHLDDKGGGETGDPDAVVDGVRLWAGVESAGSAHFYVVALRWRREGNMNEDE